MKVFSLIHKTDVLVCETLLSSVIQQYHDVQYSGIKFKQPKNLYIAPLQS